MLKYLLILLSLIYPTFGQLNADAAEKTFVGLKGFRSKQVEIQFYLTMRPSERVESIQLLAGKHWYDLSLENNTDGAQVFQWKFPLTRKFDKDIVYRLIFADKSTRIEKAERSTESVTFVVSSPYTPDEELDALPVVKIPSTLEEADKITKGVFKSINLVREGSDLEFDQSLTKRAYLSEQARAFFDEQALTYFNDGYGVWGIQYEAKNVVNSWMSTPWIASIITRKGHKKMGISVVDQSVYVYFE